MGHMDYFKGKIRELRVEYTDLDKADIIKNKGGRCEMCGRKKGDVAVLGPSHYVKKQIVFKVQIHVHKIISDGTKYGIVICDACHVSYHLFNRLDPDAMFGTKSLGAVSDSVITHPRSAIVIKDRRKHYRPPQ